MCIFYRLIEVGLDSSAEGLMRTFRETFDSEEKNLNRYFEQNLIGFGADGASVNFSHKGGFIVKLRAFTNRNIYSVWCMPHRLELAVKAALKKY